MAWNSGRIPVMGPGKQYTARQVAAMMEKDKEPKTKGMAKLTEMKPLTVPKIKKVK